MKLERKTAHDEIADDLLFRLREEVFGRQFAKRASWLQQHHSLLTTLDPRQRNAAQFVGYFSQWVDAGYGDLQLLRELLNRFPRDVRARLPLSDCFHLLLADGMLASLEEAVDAAIRHFDFIISAGQEVLVDEEILVLAHFWKARCLYRREEHELALTHATKARELVLGLGYRRMAAVIRVLESWVCVEQGNLQQAADLLEESESAIEDIDDWASLGNIDFGYGLIALQEGRYSQTVERFMKAIGWYRKYATPHRNLAPVLVRLAGVKRLITMRLARNIDAKAELSRKASNGGAASSFHTPSVRRCEQLRSEAFSDLAEAENLFRQFHDDLGLASVRVTRGFLFMDKGDFDRTDVEAHEAFELAMLKKDYRLLTRARILQSKLEGAKYDEGIDEGYDPTLHAQRAHDYAQDALAFAKRTDNKQLLAVAYVRLGMTLRFDFFNNVEAASECCKNAAKYLEGLRRDHVTTLPLAQTQIWEDFRRLKNYTSQGDRADAALRNWAQGASDNKTLRQLTDEFDKMVILQVWERESHKISRVANRLSISPKKVRRILKQSRGSSSASRAE